MQNGATGTAAFHLLLIALILSPVWASSVWAESRKEDEARQALRDSDQVKSEQLAARKDAAERADRAAAETMQLSQQRVQAAAKLQQADAALQAVASRIDTLSTQQREAEEHLKARALAMQPLLPLIERLSLYPAETLLAMPASPETTLRGLMILKGLSRQMEIEAEALRRDQADLQAAMDALRAEAPNLTQAQAVQAQQAQALDQQIAMAQAARTKAEAEASAAAIEAAQAAERADTLRAALTVLEAQQKAEAAEAKAAAEHAGRQKRHEAGQAAQQQEAMLSKPQKLQSMALPAGQLQAPVIGVVVKGWGEQTDGGPATGISYHAPPAARVISPCGGRVVFAESFRSYGLLLIVNCGGGYDVVLSGFDRLDVKLGQSIVTGEPVGVMPSWNPGSTAHRPALYVELRHDGQPVNPIPWMRSSG